MEADYPLKARETFPTAWHLAADTTTLIKRLNPLKARETFPTYPLWSSHLTRLSKAICRDPHFDPLFVLL